MLHLENQKLMGSIPKGHQLPWGRRKDAKEGKMSLRINRFCSTGSSLWEKREDSTNYHCPLILCLAQTQNS